MFSKFFLNCIFIIINYTTYWQASHSSKPASPGRIVQTGPSASAAAAAAAAKVGSPFDTEFKAPPLTVDFST
jgi:hypothetical protein